MDDLSSITARLFDFLNHALWTGQINRAQLIRGTHTSVRNLMSHWHTQRVRLVRTELRLGIRKGQL